MEFHAQMMRLVADKQQTLESLEKGSALTREAWNTLENAVPYPSTQEIKTTIGSDRDPYPLDCALKASLAPKLEDGSDNLEYEEWNANDDLVHG